MTARHPHIYLASQSPRRRELLKQIGVRYEMLLLRNDSRREVGVDETPHDGEAPVDYVQRVCRGPELAALAMAASSVTVVSLSLLLKRYIPPARKERLRRKQDGS